MAELKLSAIWKISNFAERNALVMHGLKECKFESGPGELAELRHKSLPGLQWQTELYTASRGEKDCKKGFAAFYLAARFGPSSNDTKYVWASYTATLLDGAGRDVASDAGGLVADEFLPRTNQNCSTGLGLEDSFKIEDVNKVVSGGALCIRIDLTVVKIGEMLKFRKLVRGLLAKDSTTDFSVKVGCETFGLHKCIMAKTSNVFARMFESGLEEVADGVLTLPDTTPEAFKAFTHAIYFDSWDFLSDTDLTQAVLHLAGYVMVIEKYNVGSLKRFCDDSLAEKVDEANALEILLKSAALCTAEKTKSACAEILARHMEFTESDTWLDFKNRSYGVALEILNIVSDKWIDAHKQPASSPAALKAFTQAAFFDNYEFLSDVDLTQNVLHMATTQNFAQLKRCCDESLAEGVNETNALEILTKCAVPCNAERTREVCIDILAEHPEFNESQTWLEFKKCNQQQALDISGVVIHKMRLALSFKSQNGSAANAGLKRNCEETEEISNVKRIKE